MSLFRFAAIFASLIIGACTHGGGEPPEDEADNTWRTSSPEAQGLESAPLAAVLRSLDASDLPLHSVLIVRHGVVVLDAYVYPFARGSTHNLASSTKSFTATLVGIALDEGHIGSVHDPVLSYFPARTIANRDAYKEALTIEHLLTMRAGLRCPNDDSAIKSTPDPLQTALDLPMDAEPGTTFCYNNANAHLLAGVVEASTGMRIRDYAKSRLFTPVGISSASWPLGHGGQSWGGGSLFLTPSDLARLGMLYLEKGVWRGRRVVSESWVTAATTPASDLDVAPSPLDGYGYQWWTSSQGFYSTRGHGGQLAVVLPALDLVMVITAAASDPEVLQIAQMLKVALLDAAHTQRLAEDPAALADLRAAISEMAEPEDGDVVPVPILNDVALQVSGHAISIPIQVGGPSALTLTFTEGSSTATGSVTMAPPHSRTFDLVIGLDGQWRDWPGLHGLLARARGSWTTPQTFVLEVDTVANLLRAHVELTFDPQGGVDIVARDLLDNAELSVHGTVQP